MSRELLKRAVRFMSVVGCSNDDICELCDEIKTYLAQPDEPVGYVSPSSARVMAHDGAWDSLQIYSERFSDADVAMYLSPHDQSARIAAIEEALQAEKKVSMFVMDENVELKDKLAALQAKREQLTWDELQRLSEECGIEWSSDAINFARAIEAAHGIKP